MAYLGPEAYSESCLNKHIQAYSGIFDSDSYNNINFLFFDFNLTYFSTEFKMTWLQWRHFTARRVYLNNTRSFKIVL